MKAFKTHLKESNVKWRTDTFSIIFLTDIKRTPLMASSKLFKNLEKKGLLVYHVTNYEGAIDVIKNQKRRNFQLSSSINTGEILSYRSGVHRSGVGLLLKGDIPLSFDTDFFTVPDNSGYRWFLIEHLTRVESKSDKEKFEAIRERLTTAKIKIVDLLYDEYIKVKVEQVPGGESRKNPTLNDKLGSLSFYSEKIPKKVKEKYIELYIKTMSIYMKRYEKELQNLFLKHQIHSMKMDDMDNYAESVVYNYTVRHVLIAEKDTDQVYRDSNYLQEMAPFNNLISLVNQKDLSHTIMDNDGDIVNNPEKYPDSSNYYDESERRDEMERHNRTELGIKF